MEMHMADAFPQLDWDGLKMHFVAVGGVGMSALARIAAARGAVVTGCDAANGPALADLRRAGIACRVGHSPDHLDGADVVVYSSAVPLDNPELRAARGLRLRLVSRGRLLGWLQRGHDTVAVAGMHGKTTTTWIVANMLIRCGADPSVAVGGLVPDLGGNWRVGAGRLFVTEADESDGSFLHLAPTYPVVTNIDEDHLDYWSGIDEIRRAFADFARPSDGGATIACIDGPHVRQVLGTLGGRTITCGIGAGDVAAENLRLEPGRAVYDAVLPGETMKDVVLSLPGRHNVQNSLAALALAVELDLPRDGVREAFAHTAGVDRRLQKRGCERGVTVYDDYAHHPAEIAATLEAARALAGKRLVGVFQPHRYTRTLHLHEAFAAAFDRLDLLLVAPIYAASEPAIEGVTAGLIGDGVRARGTVPCEQVEDLTSVPDRLAAELAPGDMVITLGAGDVWQAGEALLERVRQESGPTADAAGT
jgi:UDP-N-acetylmuramate--alanine ligase